MRLERSIWHSNCITKAPTWAISFSLNIQWCIQGINIIYSLRNSSVGGARNSKSRHLSQIERTKDWKGRNNNNNKRRCNKCRRNFEQHAPPRRQKANHRISSNWDLIFVIGTRGEKARQRKAIPARCAQAENKCISPVALRCAFLTAERTTSGNFAISPVVAGIMQISWQKH